MFPFETKRRNGDLPRAVTQSAIGAKERRFVQGGEEGQKGDAIVTHHAAQGSLRIQRDKIQDNGIGFAADHAGRSLT